MFNILKYILIVFVTFCTGFFIGLMAIPLPEKQIQPPTHTLIEDEIWSKVNEWRKNQGFNEYQLSPALCGYAELRAVEIQKDWSHTGIMKMEKEIFLTTRYTSLGENLAQDGFPTAENYLYAWLASPTHKANLESNYDYSCIKCKDSYCVQLFAK